MRRRFDGEEDEKDAGRGRLREEDDEEDAVAEVMECAGGGGRGAAGQDAGRAQWRRVNRYLFL